MGLNFKSQKSIESIEGLQIESFSPFEDTSSTALP